MGYLTAFFNSKIFRFAFKEYFPELLGDTRELSKVFFETVTVNEITEDQNSVFENLVETIQCKKENGESIDLLLQEVEQRIAEIYSLTEAELELINASETYAVPTDSLIIERSSTVSS